MEVLNRKEVHLDRQTANLLSPLMSVPQGVFDDYIQYRLDIIYRSLEGAKDFDEVARLQGQITEVKRLKHIRETIKQGGES